jgi:hypothetical protein
VPVNDVSDAQRNAAFVTALGQVLTRVAGGQDLRSNAGYGDAMKNAASLVRKYQYQRSRDWPESGGGFRAGHGASADIDAGCRQRRVKPPVLLLVQARTASCSINPRSPVWLRQQRTWHQCDVSRDRQHAGHGEACCG